MRSMFSLKKFKDQCNKRGNVAIIIGISLFMLIGFGALAVDIGHLLLVKNELQNAADAGALAGAQSLHIDTGNGVYKVNENANEIARAAALQHISDGRVIEIESVERGHWSFYDAENGNSRDYGFKKNETDLEIPDLWDVSTLDLDRNGKLVNAVKVVTRRTSASSFLARILGYPDFLVKADAVAYIGFAGTLLPGEADQPIAICEKAILSEDNKYTCGYGRMINSGSKTEEHQSGGWTNFTQPCVTTGGDDKGLVCAGGNPKPLVMGNGMGTTGGMVQTMYDKLLNCWQNNRDLDSDDDNIPDQPWPMTLPVISCPSNNTGNCSIVKGAVEVNIVWITRTDKNQMQKVPRKMYNPDPVNPHEWSCASTSSGTECWESFVKDFNLVIVDQNNNYSIPATYEDKTIYFLVPRCFMWVV